MNSLIRYQIFEKELFFVGHDQYLQDHFYYMIRHFLVFSALLVAFFTNGQTWQEAQEKGAATLEVQWMTSVPFIQQENGSMSGLEYELLEGFATYLKTEKDIDLTLDWTNTEDFAGILRTAKDGNNPNFVGVSAFSITEERRSYAQFSKSYLPDVTVLVSSKGTSIVRSTEEMYYMMESMTAVTIAGTSYEKMLLDLKNELNLNFEMIYIGSDKNILDYIAMADDRFGFIDLPIYLMLVQNGGELVRQNFFTVTGMGYGYLLTNGSDWTEPLNEYLRYAEREGIVSDLTRKYMGMEVYNFLNNLYVSDEIGTSILTKEKELQVELIKQANLELEKEQSLKTVLFVGMIIVTLFLVIIGYLFYRNQNTTKLLLGQKDQIYEQREDIKQKNEQLVNRNAQLLKLNEEKNDLIKILAHDIRSPLSQIIMIANILSDDEKENLVDKKDFLNQVSANASRINEMVAKILDIEGMENQTMKVLHERIDVRSIITEVKNRYIGVAAKKEIQLLVSSSEENTIIRTDHLLLTLVLENLVSNAIKFSNAGKVVKLEADCKYDGVVFKVSDQGPGFTEEDKEKVFSRFQKLSAKPTGGEDSIGLGLNIVKKYVTEMGGEVWLESEVGVGTTFFVKLTI